MNTRVALAAASGGRMVKERGLQSRIEDADGAVQQALEELLRREPKDIVRALNRLLLVDVLLDQCDCTLPYEETDGKVIAVEQSILALSWVG